jgi:Bax protein
LKFKQKLLFITAFLFLPLSSFAEFISWKDIKAYYQNENIDIFNLDEDQIARLPIINALPEDFENVAGITDKKTTFYQVVIPLIIKNNYQILQERTVVETLQLKFRRLNKISVEEIAQLKKLQKKYRVDYTNIDEGYFKKLKEHIDIIPVSVSLAQAIIESGWGQSRFSFEANALFGQWTYNENQGVVPKDRDHNAKHAIKKFDTLLQSVSSYSLNINSHPAYLGFRTVRRVARIMNAYSPVDAKIQFLSTYAGIGDKYIEKLEIIIDQNDLNYFDSYLLRNTDVQTN